MRFCFPALLIFGALPVFGDDLQPLGDEFGDAGTLARWSRIYQVEGWGHNQLETWDIDTTTSGHMRMMPHTSSWFNNLRGVLVHKPLTGDFIVTAHLSVGSRSDPTQPPSNSFSLAGIFVHRPIPSRLNGTPVPLPAGAPAWPPSGYTTDWAPGQENYIFLSYGAAAAGGTRQYEVKTTISSGSQLYYDNRGIPDSPQIELQLAIVGQTAVVMRRHPGGNWIVENRYTVGGGFRREIPNFDHDGEPSTPFSYQVGITTYTDWPNMTGQFDPSNNGNTSFASQFHQNYSLLTPANGWQANPDLIADVDYLRFARPDPALTEALLQALPVDFNNFGLSVASAPLAELPATGAGLYLGDNADLPLGPAPEPWRTTSFTSNVGLPSAAWNRDFDGGGLTNLIEYILGGDPADSGDDLALLNASQSLPLALTFTPDNSVAGYVNLAVEKSSDLSNWNTVATKSAGSATWSVPEPGTTVSANSLSDLTTVTIASAGSSHCFLRLRASLP